MRIGAVQCLTVPDDLDHACDVLAWRLEWADREAIDLVLFPEAFVLGHSYDPQIIERRAQRNSATALPIVCDRLRGFRATLVVGAFERQGSTVVNNAIVIENGCVIGRYAKAYPNEPGVTAGTDFPIFERSGIRYGINICNDANYPDAAKRLADQRTTLILCPLNNMLKRQTAASWRNRSVANLVARAQQTGCWVASADVIGEVGDLLSYGCTMIIRPDGEIMGRVSERLEGATVFDLSLAAAS
jgi:5-aminopentanamidase